MEGTIQSRSQSFVPLDQQSENESSGSNHYERTKEITEFWLSGSLRICIYGACLKWLLPELSFSDRWSRGTKLWERDWALFERYKAIDDNSKKKGRGRESFEFFEIMDEFLGCSDKVRPKFVKQTQLLENKKNGESENLDKEFRSRGKLRDICFTLGNRFSRVTAGTTGN